MQRHGRWPLHRRDCIPPEGLFCNHAARVCTQNRVDGSDYCITHILEDGAAAYKPCSYVSVNSGRRCTWPAPKSNREGYCIRHSRKLALTRRQKKPRPAPTAVTLLQDLEHYVPRTATVASVASASTSNSVVSATGTVETELKGRIVDSIAGRALECDESSDSGLDQTNTKETWNSFADSEAESVDSEQEDPLKHAGVYTAEEVALICRDKLIRLQALYIEQFKYLNHLLRKKHGGYLQATKKDGQAKINTHVLPDNTEQRAIYEKMKALRHYQRKFGKEALLQRQSKERRVAFSEGEAYTPGDTQTCVHMAGDLRCETATLPLSKHCLLHILQDSRQVLYRSCDYGGACRRPVTSATLDARCSLHAALPPVCIRYSRRDAETEDKEEHVDVVDVSDVKDSLDTDL